MMQVDGRRLLRAVGLTAVLFFLAGGGVGFVLAAGEDEQLAVPEPKPGDRAVYDVQRILLDENLAIGGPGDIRLDQIVYEWQAERWVVDEQFGDRLARPLYVQYLYMVGTPSQVMIDRTVLYDALDGRALFQEFGGSSRVARNTLLVGNVIVGNEPLFGSWTEERYAIDQYDYQRTPCGMVTPLQGTVYDGSDVVLPGLCGWTQGDNQGVYRGTGWSGNGPDRAYGFTSLDDDRLRMSFTGRSPFPSSLVSSSAEITHPDWAVGRLYRLDLVSYQSGRSAFTPVDVDAVPAASGPAPTVALTPWTLDDTGMEALVPFTLRDAYAAALAVTTPSSPAGQANAADWLRAHPKATLPFAMTLEYHDQNGARLPQWILLWADGSAWLGKRVSLESEAGGLVVPVNPLARPAVTDWTPSWLPDDVDAYFPDQDEMPTALPQPIHLVPRYLQVFGDEAPLNRYGIQVYCPDLPCNNVQVLAEVGWHNEDAQAQGNPIDDRVAIVDKLQVASNGELEQRVRFVANTPAAIPLGASNEPPATRDNANGPDRAAVWTIPNAPEAATGISFLALLGGALYYFWPSLKGLLGFGLFSRIEDDQVLDHPTRRRIHDAITAEPGIHFQALTRKAQVGRGTLEHHLRKLAAADLLVVRRSAGYTCYFAKGQVDRRLADAAPALRSDGSRAILRAVAANPGTSSRDLASQLGIAPSTVSYHLKRLGEAGLVVPGDRAGVRVTDLGSQAAA